MKARHRVSRAAIELIARFEGYRRKAAQLPDGRWMIGYGHTLTAREGAEVSEQDAEALLLYDLIAVSHVINEQAYAPLNQNQFDALCSFVFNIGTDAFRQSGVLRRLNAGAYLQAGCAMELWRKADLGGERIVVDALVRRRAAEKALFLTPPDGWPIAPSPLLRPLLDVDTEGLVPRQAPSEVTASVEGEAVRAVAAGEPIPAPAPPEEDDALSPVRAAAEAVTARLQTIFPEPAAEAPAEAPVEVAPAFVLAPPEEPLAEPATNRAAFAELEPELDGPPNHDLFSAAANDTEEPELAPFDEAGETQEERVLINDMAPFEIASDVLVQPLPEPPRGGVFAQVLLAVIGLAFMGGGVFWALNAGPRPVAGPVGPLTVGWLAGIAGVGLFSVAVFLFLRRLAGADEDEAY